VADRRLAGRSVGSPVPLEKSRTTPRTENVCHKPGGDPMRHLWIAGLLLACAAAIALAVLPVELSLVPGFLLLVLGLALFGVGVFLRQRQEGADIAAAMKRFAQANGGAFQETMPAEQLPASIPLFRRGDSQRCANAIALPCAGRNCLLFRLECYYRRAGGRGVGTWYDYYVAYLPQALPALADFQVQHRFSHRGPLVWVAVVSSVGAASSLVSFAVTGSSTSLVQGLLYSAGFLVLGALAVLLVRWTSRPAAAPAFLDPQTLKQFSRQGLCAECVGGNLAVWNERTLERVWRTGWHRSFRPVDQWIPEELQGLLEGVRQVLSRADPAAGQNPDGAKPGPANG
jgi:hypothetical protein